MVYERRARSAALTPAETDTLRLVAEGRTNREIAAALFVAEITVKVRLSNIFAKLDARDRVEAVNRAVAAGILPPRA